MKEDIKKLLLEDETAVFDLLDELLPGSVFNTEFIASDQDGNDLFTTHNKMVIGGSIFTLGKLFNVTSAIDIPTLNTDLNVEATETAFGSPGYRYEHAIQLFGIGTDGSGDTYGSVNTVDFKQKGIDPTKLVPFRYPLKTSDLSSGDQAKYAMKADKNTRYAYFLKKFETNPVIKSVFSDGTVVTSNVWQSVKTEAISTYIEVTLKISKEEVREWFQAEQGGIQNGRINTIAFYFGYPVTVAGPRTEYRGVRAFSKINFNNEPLDDAVKEINGIYRIYIS